MSSMHIQLTPNDDGTVTLPDGTTITITHGSGWKLAPSLFKAVEWISGDRKPAFHMDGVKLACDLDQHPDGEALRNWLKRGGHDPQDFDVIGYVLIGIRSEWATIPHRTLSQHRALFRRIASISRELSEAMNETGTMYVRGGGYGMKYMDTFDLLTATEAADFDAANAPDLPTVQDLLGRVALAAQRLERQGSLHSQPNKRGAERGYFVRRMGELFQRRYGEQPHEVIAALTTIALGEETDRELVSKLLAKPECSRTDSK